MPKSAAVYAAIPVPTVCLQNRFERAASRFETGPQAAGSTSAQRDRLAVARDACATRPIPPPVCFKPKHAVTPLI